MVPARPQRHRGVPVALTLGIAQPLISDARRWFGRDGMAAAQDGLHPHGAGVTTQGATAMTSYTTTRSHRCSQSATNCWWMGWTW